MKRFNPLFCSVVVLAIVPASARADFQAGQAAYRDGDYATALAEFQNGAAAGEARAMFGLGVLFASGRGVAQDPAASRRWFRKAADLGMAAAQ